MHRAAASPALSALGTAEPDILHGPDPDDGDIHT